jgi:hypothetical protein
MHAPLSVVLVIGSPEPLRKSKPQQHRHRRVTRELWRPRESIPQRDGDRLRRLAERMREACRQQIEAARADGRAALDRARPVIRAMLAPAT